MTSHTAQRLQMKDLVLAAVFTALYFVICFVVMWLGVVSPLVWMLTPSLDALIGGTVFVLYLSKVQKPFAVLVLGAIFVLLWGLLGQWWLPLVIGYAVAVLCAELTRKSFGYQSVKGMVISHGFYGLGLFFSSCGTLWFFREKCIALAQGQGFPPEYISQMQALSQWWVFVLLTVVTFLAGVIGGLIGAKLLRKHFAKAGLV